MSSVYLIRHGQAGPRHKYDALSDLGRTQARFLGEYFASQKIVFRAVYSGALSRQLETAEAVRRAAPGMPEIVIDPQWNEFDLGSVYESLAPRLSEADPQFHAEHIELMRAIQDENSPIHRTWTRCDTLVVRAWIEGRYPCSAESWTAFQTRVGACLDTLAKFDSGDAVAVFTSATPIGIWTGLALGLNDWRLMRLAGVLYNSAFCTFRLRATELTLFSFNNVPHLPDPSLRTFR